MNKKISTMSYYLVNDFFILNLYRYRKIYLQETNNNNELDSNIYKQECEKKSQFKRNLLQINFM